MEWVAWAIGEVLALVGALLKALYDRLRKRPGELVVLAIAVARMFGTTVQTGWWGVLFRFGRARRVLDPGFTWLMPLLEGVKKLPGRAVTLDLPPQRVATADGLVYDAAASLVVRIHDPIAALVEVDDVMEGCRNAAALSVYEVIGTRDREAVRDRQLLDEEFNRRARARLGRWGVEVERAGFTNIAPTVRTLRITQLGALVSERAAVLRRLRDGGVTERDALALLGSERRPISHTRAHLRRWATARGAVGLKSLWASRVRMSFEELAEAHVAIESLVRDAFGAGDAVIALGPRVLPVLRERIRRTGNRSARERLEAAVSGIEAKSKQGALREAPSPGLGGGDTSRPGTTVAEE